MREGGRECAALVAYADFCRVYPSAPYQMVLGRRGFLQRKEKSYHIVIPAPPPLVPSPDIYRAHGIVPSVVFLSAVTSIYRRHRAGGRQSHEN